MKKFLRIAAILLGIIVITFIVIAVSDSTEGKLPDMNAKVEFDGQQFRIGNENSFDWTNVKFRLNSDYELRASRINAQSEYTVGIMQFTKSDGEVFNPFTHKVVNVIISAYTPDDRYISWSGAWQK